MNDTLKLFMTAFLLIALFAVPGGFLVFLLALPPLALLKYLIK